MGKLLTRRSFIYLATGPAYLRSSYPSAEVPQGKVSAGGLSRYLNAQQFGIVADAGEDGSGTDNRNALQAFFEALGEGIYSDAFIPPGRYAVSDSIYLLSNRVLNLTLRATDVELVFTTPSPQQGRAYLTLGTTSGLGEKLVIEGLTARLCRPAVRTSNSDMLRLKGYRDYHVEGVTIPSADNMGLVIGRGEPLGRTPDSITIRECNFGGRRESMPHSNGSIGDTAIWIVTPARNTRVERCRIRETGDDGIYVGHSNSKLIERVVIKENTLTDTTCGIGVSVANAEIDGNEINRTACFAIRCEYQDGADASGAQIRNNRIIRAGQLESGDIAETMIKKVHPHAIFIYQPGGRILIKNNFIDSPRECGVVMLPHREGSLDGVYVNGGVFRNVGVNVRGEKNALGSASSVFKRSGSNLEACHNFWAFDCRLENVSQSLLSWTASGREDDRKISIRNAGLFDCDLGNNALVKLGSRGAAQLRDVSVDWFSSRSRVQRPLEMSSLQDMSTIHVGPQISP